MEKPQFVIPAGYGERQAENFHYAQAVKIGNRIETAGQGGWNDAFQYPGNLADEYAQAFDNVQRVLEAAGASWDDVVSVNSYHIPLDEAATSLMVEQLRLRMPSRRPIWTCIGVPQLGSPRMHVEIRVTAIVEE